MKKASLFVLLLSFLTSFTGLVPAVRAADDIASQADLARLQGEWSMVSGVADGYPIPEQMAKSSKRICAADVTTVTMNGELVLKARVTLDPSKTPKTIDYENLEGASAGSKRLGIYTFEGDAVKFCFGEPGGRRPVEFASKAGDRNVLSLWKKNPAETKRK
jgi:uncharacterized protein (TIGR03067 family)